MILREIISFDIGNYGYTTKKDITFIHYTHSLEDAESIKRNGFLSTAKKYNQKNLTKYDPVGVYALDSTDINLQKETRPYVLFKIVPTPTIFENPMDESLKTTLSKALGFNRKKLTNFLLKNNIDVLHSSSEYIILDTRNIVFI